MGSDNRVRYIDALKGFAIILVVIGHIGNGYMWTAGAGSVYYVLYNITNAFHMPLFMILSGYVFQMVYTGNDRSHADWPRLKKQVINLILIYLIWSVILGVLKLIFGSFVNSPVSWLTLLMIPIKPIQLYWYLYLLIFYYMIFGVLRKFKIRTSLLLLITLVISIVSFFVPSYLILDVKRFLNYLFYFSAGFVLENADHYPQGSQKRKINLIVTIVLFAAAVIFSIIFWNPFRPLNETFMVCLIVGFGAAVGFIMLFRKMPFLGKNAVLCYLGKHSLEIYVLHTFFLTAIRTVFSRIGLYNALVNILVCFAAGIILPLLLAFLFKKIRIYDIFFAPANMLKPYRKTK